MVKHSESPWIAKCIKRTPKDKAGVWIVKTNKNDQIFMKVGNQAEYDAKLIAAAPELLEALILAKKRIEMDNELHQTDNCIKVLTQIDKCN